jgi:hypothetical protein
VALLTARAAPRPDDTTSGTFSTNVHGRLTILSDRVSSLAWPPWKRH